MTEERAIIKVEQEEANNPKIYGFLNDVAFTYIFGNEGNSRVLACLINALLSFKGKERIKRVTIESPHRQRKFIDEYGAVFDLKASDEQGRLYNIEVQLARHEHFESRILYYLASLYSSQLKEGDKYSTLKKTIGISVVDFIMFKENRDIENTFCMTNRKSHEVLTDIFELHCVELRKFHEQEPGKLQTPFEKWLHILRFGKQYATVKELPPELKYEEGIDMAVKRLKRANSSPAMRERMEAREKAHRDYISFVHDAKAAAKAEGMAEGKVEGKVEGRAEGKAEGRAEGKAEGKAEAARKMKELGMDIDIIHQVTGISRDDIERL